MSHDTAFWGNIKRSSTVVKGSQDGTRFAVYPWDLFKSKLGLALCLNSPAANDV